MHVRSRSPLLRVRRGPAYRAPVSPPSPRRLPCQCNPQSRGRCTWHAPRPPEAAHAWCSIGTGHSPRSCRRRQGLRARCRQAAPPPQNGSPRTSHARTRVASADTPRGHRTPCARGGVRLSVHPKTLCGSGPGRSGTDRYRPIALSGRRTLARPLRRPQASVLREDAPARQAVDAVSANEVVSSRGGAVLKTEAHPGI
eukprot:scaffold50852_cov66-Phaeocystis_antarctica.AAC.4